MTASTPPLAWIRSLSSALLEMTQIPLFGHVPPFDTSLWEEKLMSFLELSHLELKIEKVDALSKDHFLTNLGTNPLTTSFTLSPLQENIHLVIASEDVSLLTQSLLISRGRNKGFSSPSFIEGFYRYFLLQLLQFFSEQESSLKPWGNLSLKMAPKTPLPEEEALAVDLVAKLPLGDILLRFIYPSSLQKALRAYFHTPLLKIPAEKAQEMMLSLSCTIGHTTLAAEEFQALKVGDFVLIDHSSYDPKTHKGIATVVLGDLPLFRARLKDQQIKITDYAFYYEELMEEHPTSEENSSHIPLENLEEEILRKEEIPLTVVVEVARFKMSLDKLLHLEPGNLLDLHIKPEEGVNLIVNGKKVASGELVKVGDFLGVKILKTS